MALIYRDSGLLIYASESDPIFGDRTRRALATQPPECFAISPLVKFECLVAPMRSGNLVLQRYYDEGFGQFLSLSMPDEAFLLGAALHARFGLKTPDALDSAVSPLRGALDQ